MVTVEQWPRVLQLFAFRTTELIMGMFRVDVVPWGHPWTPVSKAGQR